MPDITPIGPGQPSSSSSQPVKKSGDMSSELLNSPWEKMFGGRATAKELKQFINALLMDQIHQIKKSDEKWKEAMRKMKETWEKDQS